MNCPPVVCTGDVKARTSRQRHILHQCSRELSNAFRDKFRLLLENHILIASASIKRIAFLCIGSCACLYCKSPNFGTNYDL